MQYLQKDHLSLTQKHYEGLVFSDTIFERSSIDNCQIKDMHFTNCIFDRSSFTCIRAQGSTFSKCLFRNVDLFSCVFSNCTFDGCDFALAEIRDNTFFECQITENKFTGAMLKENEFLTVKFICSSLLGSTTSLNCFRHTDVIDSEFGNCTVDYNIVEHCTFNNSWLNTETLGTFFGLNLDGLHDCKFLYLGKPVLEADYYTLLSDVRTRFEADGQYMEAFIMDLNRSLNHLLPGTTHLCTQIKGKVLSGGFVPSEQLQFVFNVFKELYHRRQLGFLALHTLMQGIQDILETLSPSAKQYEKFILLYNNLNLLCNSMLADLVQVSDWDYYLEDRSIVVRFKFENKPSLPLTDILDSCHTHVYGCLPEIRPLILLEETGSYISIIEMSIYTLFAFRICTFLLVGSVKDLVKLRANVGLLVKKKLPRKYYLAATKPEPTEALPQAISALLTGLIKKALPKMLKDMHITDISEDNLVEISETIREESLKKEP